MAALTDWMKSSGLGDFFSQYGKPMAAAAAGGGLLAQGNEFLFGKDAKSEPFSTLNPAQEGYQSDLLQQLSQSNPQLFKFLKQFMGDDEESFKEYAAPYMRHFQTQVIPGITERFAGGGDSGASSGLQNALSEAGMGLEQGLASARQDQGLKAAQQMQGLSSNALSPSRGTRETPGQPGAIADILKLLPAILAML